MIYITKNALRIGNYIQDIRTKNIGTVKAIKSNITAIMETTTLSQRKEEWEGVVLTEEILLRFAMVSNPYKDNYWITPSFIIDIDKTKGKTLFYHFDKKIDSVHELQNAYCDFSGGRELKIKGVVVG
jgi:hypothetical protein